MSSPSDIARDYPFESQFVDVHGSQMHYVEMGSGDPILFLHGNPTWSYLWRNILPQLADQGRCIAPDLIGFGKSDRPDLDYRFVDHVRYVEGFIEAMGLENVTFVIHDWGSALGFHYASRHEANVKGLAFMEAILAPVPSWEAMPEGFRDLFRQFRTPEVGWDLIVNQNVFIEQVLPNGIVRDLGEAEMERYREPFRDPQTRLPVWRWPNEIPIEGEPADVVEMVNTYNAWLQTSTLPKLLLYATPGALVQSEMVAWCEQHLPNLTTVHLGEGIHYLQEDHPDPIAQELGAWHEALE